MIETGHGDATSGAVERKLDDEDGTVETKSEDKVGTVEVKPEEGAAKIVEFEVDLFDMVLYTSSACVIFFV